MIKSDVQESILVSHSHRLSISYIGEGFQGFQSQPNGMGIQDHIEKALNTICRHSVRITAASRTDTGVHAEHQVVTFKTTTDIHSYKLIKALNALLPSSIRIFKVDACDGRFHPIFHCTGKVYRYRIWREVGENPFVTPYTWQVVRNLNIAAMKQAADFFLGQHDFTSFCASDSSAATKIRCIQEIVIEEGGPLINIWVRGDGFLKQMVRNMVGALIAVGLGKIPPTKIREIIREKDRRKAPATAPARGLCLVRVFYNDDVSLVTLIQEARSGYNISLNRESFALD